MYPQMVFLKKNWLITFYLINLNILFNWPLAYKLILLSKILFLHYQPICAQFFFFNFAVQIDTLSYCMSVEWTWITMKSSFMQKEAEILHMAVIISCLDSKSKDPANLKCQKTLFKLRPASAFYSYSPPWSTVG